MAESMTALRSWFGRLAHAADALGRGAKARLWPPFIAKRKALRDHLRNLFAHCEIDCVLDVGANRGQYYRFLRHEVGYRGLIVSFEPLAQLSAELERRAAYDARWRVFACALGAQADTAEINIARRTEFSSILSPDNTYTTEFDSMNAVSRVETIRIETLDRLFPQLEREHDMRNVYLKLDTQGYDLQVLQGAEALLPKVRALQSELSFVPIYQGMPDWREAVGTIVGRGFAVSGLFPVTVDERLRLIEADGVFVRSDQAFDRVQ